MIALPHRLIIPITAGGDGWLDLLDRIITADIKPLLQGQAIYSALLTPQGKYIADFFIYPTDNHHHILLETDRALWDSLKTHLSRYLFRHQIALGDSLSVAVAFGQESKNTGQYFADPRTKNKELWRIIGGAGDDEKLADYDSWRVDNLLPEGLADFTPLESMVIEYHLQNIGGVALDKGCFVGQEVTARMFYKLVQENKLKKQLVKKTWHKDELQQGQPPLPAGAKLLTTTAAADGGLKALVLTPTLPL